MLPDSLRKRTISREKEWGWYSKEGDVWKRKEKKKVENCVAK